jgi:N utilization substance protein B
MAGGRHGARRLLLQALYQRQLSGHAESELVAQFTTRKEFRRIDRDYFLVLLGEIMADEGVLDRDIARSADRPVAQLDPVERGILWIGIAELKFHPDVPVRVVIDEAVELTKEFGAQDSHRYVNAVLDSLSRELRDGNR